MKNKGIYSIQQANQFVGELQHSLAGDRSLNETRLEVAGLFVRNLGNRLMAHNQAGNTYVDLGDVMFGVTDGLRSVFGYPNHELDSSQRCTASAVLLERVRTTVAGHLAYIAGVDPGIFEPVNPPQV